MGCNCGGSKKKAYSIANVAVDILSNKAEYVDKETYNNRVNICLNCPGNHYHETLKACMICKCFVKQKAKFKQSECPARPHPSVEDPDVIVELEAPYWEAVNMENDK